ncbi:hypothetical protein [Phenylobacterium immobile]|uniref:hypothetical protein n=1 Tax=Phenylobacterium immobile TaxID=21 RepID=UPI000B0889C7|nr:hypothetical protein [Phenylobacterium immobile]
MIAFKARVRDPAVASYRYRVLTAIQALRSLGCAAEEYDRAREGLYTAVVFSKAYGADDQVLARRLAAAGVRVVLDLCDNHFYNPRGLPDYDQAASDLRAMIAVCDEVICSTPVLAAQIEIEAGLAYRPKVAPDFYEQAATRVGGAKPVSEPAQLLWFGVHGAPNAPAGMSDLLLIRAELAEAFALRPFELTICSNSEDAYDRLSPSLPVPTRYVEWSQPALETELSAADGVIIPLSDNAFVAGKTHNRLTLALSAGAPVVADPLDAYRPFAAFARIGDWGGGLAELLRRPAEAFARAAPAEAFLKANWSPQALAPIWAEALGAHRAAEPRALAVAATGGVQAWLQAEGRNLRRWLIAGPDADPDIVAAARREGWLVLALGVAAQRLEADAAWIADIRTLEDAPEAVLERVGVVWAPASPREDGVASALSLGGWTERSDALQNLKSAGRLLRAEPADHDHEDLAGDYADEAATLRILARAGVSIARRIGLGAPRPGFEALQPYGARRSGGAAIVRRTTGISYGPYGYPSPARVFVGADEEQKLGARVLAYSIERRSTMDVVVEVLDVSQIPEPQKPENRSKTGFSFARFDIPRLCDYDGRGIYLDADMLVFGDIADLWTQPLDEADLLYSLSHPHMGRTPQTAVMLLNCRSLDWDVGAIVRGLDDGAYTYGQLMGDLCIVHADRQKPGLPYWWNSLEQYDPGRTCLLHYTDMDTQPWVTWNRNGGLWLAALRDALDEGYISRAEVDEAVANGHVSPQLPVWLGLAETVSDEVAAALWVAPYHRFLEPSGPIEGRVSLTSDGILAGWAWRPNGAGAPVTLRVLDGEDEILRIVPGDYAAILERHGKGDGRHAFAVALPDDLRNSDRPLRVIAEGQDEDLAGSPLRR